MADLYGDPAAIWRDWATDVRASSIDCGHHVAEEAPDRLAAELSSFLRPIPPDCPSWDVGDTRK
jgi:haloacetate dehalogenase